MVGHIGGPDQRKRLHPNDNCCFTGTPTVQGVLDCSTFIPLNASLSLQSLDVSIRPSKPLPASVPRPAPSMELRPRVVRLSQELAFCDVETTWGVRNGELYPGFVVL